MPTKAKVTKEVLIDIAKHLFRPNSPAEFAEVHGLTEDKILRLASKLRKEGAKIPRQPRFYKNSLTKLIGTIKSERPELFA